MDETQTEAGVGPAPALGRVVVDTWMGCYGDGWKRDSWLGLATGVSRWRCPSLTLHDREHVL